jgi:ribonucleoside-diphosphate reductase alpha chain
MFEDGSPGEVFIVMAKQGSTVSGLMDAFATGLSIALQHGVPLSALVDKFSHMRFEPSGFTNNAEIPVAKSVVDYIARWLAGKFLEADGSARPYYFPGSTRPAGPTAGAANGNGPAVLPLPTNGNGQEDAPSCHNCGDVMVRNGTCYKCNTCGETSGCS